MRQFDSLLDLEDTMDFDELYPGDFQAHIRLHSEIADDDAFLDWDDSAFDYLSDDI